MKTKLIMSVVILAAVGLLVWLVMLAIRDNDVGPGVEEPAQSGVGYSPPLEPEAIEAIEESNRLNAPAVYLANTLPYENETFRMDYRVDPEKKAFVFVVTPKTESLQAVQDALYQYFAQIELSAEQIETLYIEYAQPVD